MLFVQYQGDNSVYPTCDFQFRYALNGQVYRYDYPHLKRVGVYFDEACNPIIEVQE